MNVARFLISVATVFSIVTHVYGAPVKVPPVRRELPKPLPSHPGNVFLAGEEVDIPLPKPEARWRLVDYEGHDFGEPIQDHGTALLGPLKIGFYRLEQTGSSNWISLGVLGPLRAPTPATSPVGLDVAMAWFYPEQKMAAVAELCALAGVNWVRDRLNWPEMEPQKGNLALSNKYDASAKAQAGAGLQVLQVIHASPRWANQNGKRFPLDLRDAYHFFEAMARRWQGQVRAFEPWNEADIPMFGGHTGSEMATLQKAAYLGLKAGDPDLIACLNVFAVHNTNQLGDLYDNEAWPYYDTYNLHHYEAFDKLPKVYADHRAVSAGHPLWVSECAVPVKWAGDANLKEPTDADLKVQAERVAKTFACSLHEGSAATFYFLLPHYVEGQTQFGVLRPDLTPRPAFVALAAVGRLLADAKPLGRLTNADPAVRSFLFRAKPDGQNREVLVAWTTNGQMTLRLPMAPAQIFDHLGRSVSALQELKLGTAPLFAILPIGSGRKLPLMPPPNPPPVRKGKPSVVVLQALCPSDKLDLKLSACRIDGQSPIKIPIFAYNFGRTPVRGRIQTSPIKCYALRLPETLELAPEERKELTLVAEPTAAVIASPMTVRVSGDFGSAGKPVLSFRLVQEKPK